MANTVTRTSSVGLFSRLSQSLKSVVVGFIIFLLAFPLLFWNEGRAVQTAKSLTEGSGAVQTVTIETVDPTLENALVHFSGETETTDTLTDPNFGVSVQAVQLRREVEMYQWKQSERSEKRDKIGGGQETITTYTYDQVWEDDVLDSTRFEQQRGHQNPGSIRYEGETWVARPVTVGAYTLDESLVRQMSNFEDYTISPATELPPSLQGIASAHEGRYYFGSIPTQPAVGDIRVSFDVVYPEPVSVIAQQAGTGTRGYQTEAGDTLAMLQMGSHSAEAMFSMAQSANATMTWILRALGYFMMFMGLSALFRPFALLAGVVPIFGRAVSLFAGLVAGVIAFMFWFVAVGIAWLFVRPVLGIALLLGGALMFVVGIVLIVLLFRAYKANQDEEEPGS
ncbi:MAG: hypothetical protein ACJAZO_002793 [Myxococcota bacterium]|jgi:hypothetical protein